MRRFSAHERVRALRLLAVSSLLLGALALPTPVAAQARGPRLHVGAGMVLDFSGEVQLNRGSAFNIGYDSLRATPGVRGHLDYEVQRFVTLGGLARISFWEPSWTPRIGRSFLLDLAPRVLGKFDYRQFRFYGGLAPGLTISAVQDRGVGVSNPAAGFTLSITALGVEWWFARKAALFAELGWVGHWFTHNNDASAGDLHFRLSQGMFELGFVFGA